MGLDVFRGNLRNGSNAGLSYVNARNGLSNANWNIAGAFSFYTLMVDYTSFRLRKRISFMLPKLDTPGNRKPGQQLGTSLSERRMLGLVDKPKAPCIKKRIQHIFTMKKYCKYIDITDRDFIRSSIYECIMGGKNGKSKIGRRDVLTMFEEYSHVPYKFLSEIAKSGQHDLFTGVIETVTDGVQMEIINREYHWKPIWHSTRIENDKVRNIGIQDIKQQIFDYIAVNGLKELFDKKIGYYQCAAIPNRGQKFGKNAVKKWVADKHMRYAWKGDAKHYYENIDTKKLKSLLERYVKNEPLLHLTFSLIDSFDKGLEIGSYLSQYLANFYMSFAYHWAEENFVKTRKHKNGTESKVRLVYHQLYYMDDILFMARALKDLKKAVKIFKKFLWEEMGIEIKEDDTWIDLQTGYIDMMGFCISRTKCILRSRIFLRFRRQLNKIKKHKIVTISMARSLVSRNGWIKNANCRHWRKKNKSDMIVKICEEMISSGKNVIRLEAKSGRYCVAA